MKEVVTKFKCDISGDVTEVISKDNSCSFPYDKGWVYLHSLNIQFNDKNKMLKRLDIIDKHFKDRETLLAFISDQIRSYYTGEKGSGNIVNKNNNKTNKSIGLFQSKHQKADDFVDDNQYRWKNIGEPK